MVAAIKAILYPVYKTTEWLSLLKSLGTAINGNESDTDEQKRQTADENEKKIFCFEQKISEGQRQREGNKLALSFEQKFC